MGTAGNMIGVYERGEVSPTIHQLERISKALRLSLEELLAGPPQTDPGSGSAPVPASAPIHEVICPIPYADDWHGEPLSGSDVLLWPIPRAVLPHEGCLVTRIGDDAMHPFLLRGDAVIINPDARRPRSGALVLLESRRRTHVRRFLILRRQRSFEAFNPLYPTLPPEPEVRVLGCVVALVERNLQDGVAFQMGWATPPVSG
jgi:transcriptional regulator with XRE-family HTH domain